MAIGTVIGSLIVKIGSDISGLKDGVKDADSSLESLGKGIGNVSSFLIKFALAAATAGAGLTIALVHNSLEAVDAQFKLAKQLGGTTEGVQTLDRAAQLAGVSSEELRKSMQVLDTRLGEAGRTAEGPTSEALKRLGLSVKELTSLDADKRLALIADKMAQLGYTTQQQNDTLKQFGIRSKEMFQIIADGGDALREARDDVVKLGIAVSEVDAKQIEAANDAMTSFKAVASGIGNTLATKLAPVLLAIGNGYKDYATEAGLAAKAGELFDLAVNRIIENFSMMTKIIYEIRIGWDALMALLLNSLNQLLQPFQSTFSAIASVIDTVMNSTIVQTIKSGAVAAVKTVADNFSTLPDVPRAAFETISHGYGDLKSTLEKPWSSEQWIKSWEERKKESEINSMIEMSWADEVKNNAVGNLRQVSEAQQKKYDDSLAKLNASVATEAEALKVAHDKQLLDLENLNKTKLMSMEDYNRLKLKIEEKYQKSAADLIWNSIEKSTRTEQEIRDRAHAEQLRKLDDLVKAQNMTEQKAADERLRIEEKHALDKLQLQAKTWSTGMNIVETAMQNISSIMGSEGGKAFQVMKATSIATALVKGYEAAVSAYAFGTSVGGPIVGAIFAGIAAAGTAALIAKLYSAQPAAKEYGGQVYANRPYQVNERRPEVFVPTSSGNIVSSIEKARNMGLTPMGRNGGEGNNSVIEIRGLNPNSMFSGSQVRELIERVNEQVRDGATLMVGEV